MIQDTMQLRPRYGEVDQMGYVYHANYVSYCHQARTELLRKLNLNDKYLEDMDIMMPVISFNIDYKKPAHYDELISITTIIKGLPTTRFYFEFLISNEEGQILSIANSTLVFVDKKSRYPKLVPEFITSKLQASFKHENEHSLLTS
ncbi:acyl-CoA thioesterase [Ancylomarina euxinus]|uniref:Acyl-CoA thioesterase n=1 Tax=Ancylomarina euxinus TaxID=2283627 RepID=A0A425Y1V7_9BACT|nr:acyl-CoA thioesterase [Ancylomarina euxinus]MCZ4695082.1 acyl-CoA thioesterase [Ancylomarina euxinus]MUP14982.1 YbgC/FadM family acyl-CoA thioesterase [Ancylomarina euxinus]RRG21872.1 acyl-CoA thioesterase [Ancylomarina euxinus]